MRILTLALPIGILSFAVCLGLAFALRGRIDLRLPDENSTDSCQVYIDGIAMPAESGSKASYRVGPGRHIVEAVRPGFDSEVVELALLPGSRVELQPTWTPNSETDLRLRLEALVATTKLLRDRIPSDPSVAALRQDLGKLTFESGQSELREQILALLEAVPSPFSMRASEYSSIESDSSRMLWTIGDGQLRHSDAVTAVFLQAASKTMVSAGADGQVFIWDLRNGTQIREAISHPDAVATMALLSDRRLLLTGCNDKVIRLWSLDDRREVWSERTRGNITCIAFSKDGRLFAYAGGDGRVHIRRTDNRELVDQVAVGQPVAAIEFATDTSFLAAGDSYGNVALWDRKSKVVSRRKGGPPARYLIFQNDNRELLSIGANRQQGRWSLNGDTPVEVSGSHLTLAVGRDGGWFLERDLRQKAIWLRMKESDQRTSFEIGDLNPTTATFDPVLNNVVIGCSTGELVVYNATSSKPVLSADSLERPWTTAAISSDSAFLATGNSAGSVATWDTYSRRLLQEWNVSKEAVRDLHFSGDGKHLIVAVGDSIIMKSIAEPSTTLTYPGTRPMAVSRFGTAYAFCRNESVIERHTQSPEIEYQYEIKRPSAVSVHPTEESLIVANEEGEVYLCSKGDAPRRLFSADRPVRILEWIDPQRFAFCDDAGRAAYVHFEEVNHKFMTDFPDMGDFKPEVFSAYAHGLAMLSGNQLRYLSDNNRFESSVSLGRGANRIRILRTSYATGHSILISGRGQIQVIAE